MRRAQVVVVLSTALYAVTACGSGDHVTAEPGPAVTPTTTASSSLPATRLTIVVTAPGQPTQRYTLTCDPAGGEHPNAVAACAALDRMDAAFAERRGDVACTQVYGGPQVATVTGTLGGKPVNTKFTRTDGCEISRWDQHAAVLVERGGANGS